MAGLINASLNLKKIPVDKIISGEMGKYINVTIAVNNDPDKFEQHCSITVAQSKEERDAKEAKVYLGNGKVVWSDGQFPDPPMKKQTVSQPVAKPVAQEDDLPF